MPDPPLPTLQSSIDDFPGLTIYCTDRRCGNRCWFSIAALIERFGPNFPVSRVYTRFFCSRCGGQGWKRGEVYYQLDFTIHHRRREESQATYQQPFERPATGDFSRPGVLAPAVESLQPGLGPDHSEAKARKI